VALENAVAKLSVAFLVDKLSTWSFVGPAFVSGCMSDGNANRRLVGLTIWILGDGRRRSARTAGRNEALCADLAQIAGTSLNKGVEPRKPIYSGE
jgi:hypothetical protein